MNANDDVYLFISCVSHEAADDNYDNDDDDVDDDDYTVIPIP